MSIVTIKAACFPSAEVTNPNLVEQVASLEDLAHGKIDADAFFQRNHFTEGLRRLVQTGVERLAGRSDTGAYYLTQAMGGGKTHALIVFGLLATRPDLRRRVLPNLPHDDAAGARVVLFNGHQNPRNLLWGTIADQLSRPEAMERFWRNGPDSPGIDNWIATIGDEPTLILLDELPSYLQMAAGQAAGTMTLGDITIGALERLFNALPRLPKTCVVVTNLKDDVYLEGSNRLRSLIDGLTKHYDRNAIAITPVQQNSAELFEVIRRRLFDRLPDISEIEDVAQAFVDALRQAKRVDTIPSTPEVFLQRIRESYPFHPSIRDIVGRFQENRGYQKTRALIRLLRHATRSALAAPGDTYLIGLQHLDFNDQATLEEVRKINASFANAIAHDVSDRGNAVAEKIDAAEGGMLGTALAKTLLMASLSSAEEPLRGLTEGELLEVLVDPVTRVPAIKTALGSYTGNAWYLQKDARERIYVSQTANVTAEVNQVALTIAEDLVEDTLRDKLKAIFKATIGDVYEPDLAVLPALDKIAPGEERPRLVILDHAADALPPEFDAWWKALDRQNGVLLLTVDKNAIGSMRELARRMRAIEAVRRSLADRHGADSAQMRELEGIEGREAGRFYSAVREGFKTLIYPTTGRLRAYGDFSLNFQNNNYDGEGQIRQTLIERGKFKPTVVFDAEFDSLRLDAEQDLFDADAVPLASLKRNAVLRPGWYWLPRGGVEALIRLAAQRGYWKHDDGIVRRRFEVLASVTVGIEQFAPDPVETGRYTLTITRENADTVYFSERGPPEARHSAMLSGTAHVTEAAAVWFRPVDSSGKAVAGPVVEWRAPVRLRASVASEPGGYRLSVTVVPRAATVRVGWDASPSLVMAGSIVAPSDAHLARIMAELGTVRSAEEVVTLAGRGLADDPGRRPEPSPRLDDNLPATMTSRHEAAGTKDTWVALGLLRDIPGTRVLGGQLTLKGQADEESYVTLRLGASVPLPGTELHALAQRLADLSGWADPVANLRLDGVAFESGRDLQRFAAECGMDWERVKWRQN